MSEKHPAERCIKDDRELHRWADWGKEWLRQRGLTEPPFDPERTWQIAAEVKARLAAQQEPVEPTAEREESAEPAVEQEPAEVA
jgi:hypothetical protein